MSLFVVFISLRLFKNFQKKNKYLSFNVYFFKTFQKFSKKNKDLSFSVYFFKTFQKFQKKKIKIFLLVFISLRLFKNFQK